MSEFAVGGALCAPPQSYRALKSPDSIGLRPSLFKVKHHQTVTSKHPCRQNFTFKQLAENTEIIFQKLQTCAEFKAVIQIRDCDVLNFYNQTCYSFCQHFGLPLKPEFKNVIFKTAFYDAVNKQFPMFGVKKLSMQKVIDSIKLGKLHGFIKISLSIGPKGQASLRGFQPFLRFENGKVKNGFSVTDCLLSTDMVAFLLNCKQLPDVIIQNISTIHEFHKQLEKPFCASASKMLHFIEINKSEKVYSQILKQITNNFVGFFGCKANKWPKPVILHNDDFKGIQQLKNFVSAHTINPNFNLAYFNNTTCNVNLEHLNYQIIQLGRLHFLKMLVNLFTYIESGVVITCNTDGLGIGFNSVPPTEAMLQNNASILDYFVKPHLASKDVKDYVAMKLSYFCKPGVCPNHILNNVFNILEKKLQLPFACCQAYESNDTNDFKLKIELVANFGIVMGQNRCAFVNRVNKQTMVKCSGKMNSILNNITSFTEDQLKSALI